MSSNHKPGSLVSEILLFDYVHPDAAADYEYCAGEDWGKCFSWFLCASSLMHRPSLDFGQITLYLDRQYGEYVACWNGGPATYKEAPIDPEQVLWAGPSEPDVALALEKFIQVGSRLKMLSLMLGRSVGAGRVTFRKGHDGKLHIFGEGLPTAHNLRASGRL
ncbi:MAG: hypothetical protein A2542_02640 [Parcubacteria group bacterium RIFOXYD2_FULL_52_8]|nr:MAG: hypothetical protein A2542_02640 [Parcubacteria group bacterium RIFOXYD2_FULL_52_8]